MKKAPKFVQFVELVKRSNMKVRIGQIEFECTAEEFNKLDLSKTAHTIDSQFGRLEEIPDFLKKWNYI